MRIDQARQHQPAADIDDAGGTGRQNVGADLGDAAVFDGDIKLSVQASGRVDDAAAFENEVELLCHSGVPRSSVYFRSGPMQPLYQRGSRAWRWPAPILLGGIVAN
jgi:hypothetical protein